SVALALRFSTDRRNLTLLSRPRNSNLLSGAIPLLRRFPVHSCSILPFRVLTDVSSRAMLLTNNSRKCRLARLEVHDGLSGETAWPGRAHLLVPCLVFGIEGFFVAPVGLENYQPQNNRGEEGNHNPYRTYVARWDQPPACSKSYARFHKAA